MADPRGLIGSILSNHCEEGTRRNALSHGPHLLDGNDRQVEGPDGLATGRKPKGARRSRSPGRRGQRLMDHLGAVTTVSASDISQEALRQIVGKPLSLHQVIAVVERDLFCVPQVDQNCLYFSGLDRKADRQGFLHEGQAVDGIKPNQRVGVLPLTFAQRRGRVGSAQELFAHLKEPLPQGLGSQLPDRRLALHVSQVHPPLGRRRPQYRDSEDAYRLAHRGFSLPRSPAGSGFVLFLRCLPIARTCEQTPREGPVQAAHEAAERRVVATPAKVSSTVEVDTSGNLCSFGLVLGGRAVALTQAALTPHLLRHRVRAILSTPPLIGWIGLG